MSPEDLPLTHSLFDFQRAVCDRPATRLEHSTDTQHLDTRTEDRGGSRSTVSPHHNTLALFTSPINTPSGAFILLLLSCDSWASHSIYKQYFSDLPLEHADERFVTRYKDNLPVLGRINIQATHGHCSVPAAVYIVESGNPLMGIDLISSLNLCIKGNSTHCQRFCVGGVKLHSKF